MINGRMKIAFVHNTLAVGGIERSLASLLDVLDYDLLDVDLYIMTSNSTLLSEINSHVNVIFQVHNIEKFLSKRKESATNHYIICLLELILKSYRRIIRFGLGIKLFRNAVLGKPIKKQYDAVFAADQGIVHCFAIEKLFSSNKYAFYHDGSIAKFEKSIRTFSLFDGIIVVSHEQRHLIASQYPELLDMMIVVHNIVPQKNIINLSLNDDVDALFPDNQICIVSCGRLYFDKGFDIAVDAANLLVEKYERSFIWYILGEGREKKHLEKRIRQLELQNHIILLGSKVNPYPYIRKCDLYVQPSRIESFGISMVEAQILGKVVVATSTIGAKEVIQDGATGILCDIDSKDLAAKVHNVMCNRDLYQNILKTLDAAEFDSRNYEALQIFYDILKL